MRILTQKTGDHHGSLLQELPQRFEGPQCSSRVVDRWMVSVPCTWMQHAFWAYLWCIRMYYIPPYHLSLSSLFIYLSTYLPTHPSIHPETSPCFPGLPNVFPGPFTWARSASCLVKNRVDECLMAISWGYIMAQWRNNRNIYHIQSVTAFLMG